MTVVHMINGQSAQCVKAMHMIRLLVLECLKFNIIFKAVHIPGANNDKANELSCFQMQRFFASAPEAEPEMTALPPLTQVW